MLLYVCHTSRAFFLQYTQETIHTWITATRCSNQEDFAFHSLPYCLNFFIRNLFSLKNKGLILQERTLYWDRVLMGRWDNLPRLGFWSSNRALSFPCSSLTCSPFLTHTSPLHLPTCSYWVRAAVHFGDFLHLASGRHLSQTSRSFLEHDTGKSKHWSIKGERTHCGRPGKSRAHVPFPAKHNILWWIMPFILNTCYSQPIIQSAPCSCSESSSLHSCTVVRPK